MRGLLVDFVISRWRFAPVAASVFIPSAFAWAVIFAAAFDSSMDDLCFGLAASARADGVPVMWSVVTVEKLAATAILMSVAMTLPFAWRPALCVYSRSFRDDAWLLSATLVAVFGAAWAAFLVPIIIAGLLATDAISAWARPGTASVAVAIAIALWRLTNQAESALRSCHRTEPVRAFAPGCYLDCAVYGWRSALACCRACAPGMLLPFFSVRPMLAMAAITGIAAADRFGFRPDARRSAAAYAALGVLVNV
jgi:hypothetical protein